MLSWANWLRAAESRWACLSKCQSLRKMHMIKFILRRKKTHNKLYCDIIHSFQENQIELRSYTCLIIFPILDLNPEFSRIHTSLAWTKQSQKQEILRWDLLISKSPPSHTPFCMPPLWAQCLIHRNKQVLTDRLTVSVFVCRAGVCVPSPAVLFAVIPGTPGVFDIVPRGDLFRPSLAPVGAAQRLGQACDCSPPRCWEWGACLPPITPSPMKRGALRRLSNTDPRQ